MFLTESNYLQSNFAPVDELKEALLITHIEGKIPGDFPEGVYIRNGPYFTAKYYVLLPADIIFLDRN
jgi:carotenoid cleavage dioxygenase-like enzyme